MRMLWIDGKEYQWKVGRSHVVIRSDGHKFAAPHFADLFGCTPSDTERAKWKETLHITPADVAGYIVANGHKS